MDRNTILAIVLSVIVISVGLTIQTTFFAPDPLTTAAAPTNVESRDQNTSNIQQGAEVPVSYAQSGQAWDSGLPGSFVQTGSAQSTNKFNFETDVFVVEFDPKGAAVTSLRLKQHLDKGQPVEMIFNDSTYPAAFSL